MSKTSRDILKKATYKFTLEELTTLRSSVGVYDNEGYGDMDENRSLIEKLDLAIAEREHVEEPE